ncbi:hypothetical protein SASPL_143765 [Salvia splendens]|uniref:Oxidoreductase FAD/NAD(P)-binding domain-containing protein n=1 Tax=Salvia splendens TaxID=180675 RepID=A0A8X8WMT2_SALSN|nr:hypothetical protein SASPL_143765 [Salvia splendens]
MQASSFHCRNASSKVAPIRAEVSTEAPPKKEKHSKKQEEGVVGIIPDGIDKNGKPHKLRLYSIASSALGDLDDSKTVRLAPFLCSLEEIHSSFVDFDASLQVSLCVKRLVYTNDQGEVVKGVCSNFLCDLTPGAEVKIIGPVGKEMLMPKDPNTTIIMVVCACLLATGTGIAPFRSFLWKMFFEKHDDYKFNGLAWLYLVKGMPHEHVVDYAVSREQTNAQGEKMYIQTQMAEYARKSCGSFSRRTTPTYTCVGSREWRKALTPSWARIDWVEYERQLKRAEQWNVEVY